MNYARLGRVLIPVFLALVAVGLLPSLASAQAKLVVRIDGQEVENGSKFVFPATEPGSSSRLIVVLRNEGNKVLQFTTSPPVTFSARSSDDFSLVQPALEDGGTLSPNGSTAFAVDYTPASGGTTAEGAVFVFTSDEGSPFVLDLSGASPAPSLVVRIDGEVITSGTTLTFSALEAGHSEQIVVVLRNEGPIDLVFADTPPIELLGADVDHFVVTQPALESGNKLSPNGSTAFAVRYQPKDTPSGQHVAAWPDCLVDWRRLTSPRETIDTVFPRSRNGKNPTSSVGGDCSAGMATGCDPVMGKRPWYDSPPRCATRWL